MPPSYFCLKNSLNRGYFHSKYSVYYGGPEGTSHITDFCADFCDVAHFIAKICADFLRCRTFYRRNLRRFLRRFLQYRTLSHIFCVDIFQCTVLTLGPAFGDSVCNVECPATGLHMRNACMNACIGCHCVCRARDFSFYAIIWHNLVIFDWNQG